MLYVDVISFNEIFKKDVAYDNIRNHKKNMASTSLWKTHFLKKKNKGGGGVKLTPHPSKGKRKTYGSCSHFSETKFWVKILEPWSQNLTWTFVNENYSVRSSHERCSMKKQFLKTSSVGVSFLKKPLQAWRPSALLKRDSITGVYLRILRSF